MKKHGQVCGVAQTLHSRDGKRSAEEETLSLTGVRRRRGKCHVGVFSFGAPSLIEFQLAKIVGQLTCMFLHGLERELKNLIPSAVGLDGSMDRNR
jgi:hypothetical protein